MKKLILALMLSTCFLTFSAHSQVCGGGVRQYEIFVRNGVNAQNLRYEIFAVLPIELKGDFEPTAKYLNKMFFLGQEKPLSKFWIYEPQRVKNAAAEKFLAKYRVEDYQKEPEEERSFHENKRSGLVEFGEINFRTSELYDRPLLLKVFADNYRPAYLLGNHFGGCSKTYKILLEDHFLPGT